MANTAPFELICGPLEVYTGPVDEARPDLNDAPAGNWVLLGTSGSKNYAEDGVIITHEQTVENFRALGSTAIQKAHRTEEGVLVGVTLHDLTAEHYAKIMDNATVNDTAAGSGTAGVRDFDLLRGLDVVEYGILLRGNVSAYGAAFKSQYWIPRCYMSGNPEPTWTKEGPVGLELEFTAMESSSNGLGKYEAQDAAAS